VVQAARSKRLRCDATASSRALRLGVRITDGVALLEDEEGGVVFICGSGELQLVAIGLSLAPPLAAVQLWSTGVASQPRRHLLGSG